MINLIHRQSKGRTKRMGEELVEKHVTNYYIIPYLLGVR